MTHITIATQTIQSAHTSPATYVLPLKIKERPPGHILDERPSSAPRPVPMAQRQSIAGKLKEIITRAREAKIQKLIQGLQSALLPTEVREKIKTWIHEFSALSPSQEEERALSLGVLIFSGLRPALLNATSLEREQIDEWEEDCRTILRQTLPLGESVESLLGVCDIGIREERLFQERVHRIRLAAKTYLEVLRSVNDQKNTQITQGWAEIKKQLTNLKNTNSGILDAIQKQVQPVLDGIDQLGKEIAALKAEQVAIENREIPIQDSVECKDLLSRFV